MAKYDFECPACGKRVEVERSVHNDSPVYCPASLEFEVPMVQIISAASVQLKGSGWARDGYASAPGSIDER